MTGRLSQPEAHSAQSLGEITQGRRLWHVRSGGVGVQLVTYSPAREMPRHSHRTANITVILAGTLEEEVNGRDYIGGPLCVVMKPAGAVHATRIGDAGVRSLVVEVDSTQEDDLRRRYGLFDECRWFHDPYGLAVGVIRLCSALRDGSSPVQNATDVGFARIGKAAAEASRTAGDRILGVHIRRALEIIRQEQWVTTRELAARLGLHPVYLARLFRERIGCSPRQVRHEMRLRAAVNGIVGGDAPLAIVALQAGFADQSHLAREVKRHTGLPAGTLRRLGSPG